ncbi:Basic membrane lipoprotein [Mycobacterium tuberculosis]|nr:Basic membrane lipoprotein [Mycobacterium tuberculosis]
MQIFDFEPADPSQVGSGIRKFAEEGFDLVIGVGFANNPAITQAAKEFTDVKFAVIDDVPGEGKLPNAVGLVFREHEGSFLVGYIAGSLSNTGVVGFVGGMDIPLIHKFEQGYKAGAERAFAARGIKGKVLINYVGTTPVAWNDPGKGKELATSQSRQGADIIYAAAGASGLGVKDFILQKRCLKASELPAGVRFVSDNFKDVPKYAAYNQACAGNTRPMFFIGGDGNLNFLGDTDSNPQTLNHALTCMLKKVDVAAFRAVEAVVKGTFKGGILSLGLKEGGLDFALDAFNQALIPDTLRRELEALKKAVIGGQIKVPDSR